MSQSKKSSKQYIDGTRFTELSKHALKTGEFTDELMHMFYLLAVKTFRRRGTPRHSYMPLEEEDSVQVAVLACYAGI